MALGDIGMFLPAETHYGTPEAYNKMLQAEGLKRAAYLSSMDQFYENLEEAQRQYNLTLGYKEETRDLELEWARERFGTEMEFKERGLEAEEEYRSGMLSLAQRELGQKGRLESRALDIQEKSLELQEEAAGGFMGALGKQQETTRALIGGLTTGETQRQADPGVSEIDLKYWTEKAAGHAQAEQAIWASHNPYLP